MFYQNFRRSAQVFRSRFRRYKRHNIKYLTQNLRFCGFFEQIRTYAYTYARTRAHTCIYFYISIFFGRINRKEAKTAKKQRFRPAENLRFFCGHFLTIT